MSGIVTSVSGNSITITHDNKEDTYVTAVGATVTLNGVKSQLADLRRGDSVELIDSPASIVIATRLV